MAIAPELEAPAVPPSKISMFSNDQLPTVDVPLRVINRPLPSELDEEVSRPQPTRRLVTKNA